MEIFKGLYHGANITGGEGGADNTSVSLFEMKTRKDGFFLAETHENGAIAEVDGHMQVATLKNLESDGIKVYEVEVGEGNDILNNGDEKIVKVGSHTVKIVANNEEAVMLGEKGAVKITKDLEKIIYARPPKKTEETEKDAE